MDNPMTKKCPECRQTMRPVPCTNNPPASEFYCRGCHKSILMNQSQANAYCAQRVQQVRAAAQQQG